MTAPVLDLADVSKDFRGLRPLRIERLTVAPGECVAILGMDQPMAETFVNLVTGAVLPDRGEVRAFGRSTAEVADSDEWLRLVDRFGIVSDRAVLLGALTPLQNLAVPFTLDIEPLLENTHRRVAELALEVGLDERDWGKAVEALDPARRARIRFARALALDPAVLLLEHSTAEVQRELVASLGEHMRRVIRRRGGALVALTGDFTFATAVADRVLTLDQVSGRLNTPRRSWWSGRRLG